jgi:hypothetical protein
MPDGGMMVTTVPLSGVYGGRRSAKTLTPKGTKLGSKWFGDSAFIDFVRRKTTPKALRLHMKIHASTLHFNKAHGLL